MEKILVMDEHNYDDNLGEILRVAIRGIIFVDGKLLMIEDSSGEVKLPGGGMEPGEDDHQALIREVKEETGYDVIPESIKPFGEIEEKRLAVYEPMIWHQINRFIQQKKHWRKTKKCSKMKGCKPGINANIRHYCL